MDACSHKGSAKSTVTATRRISSDRTLLFVAFGVPHGIGTTLRPAFNKNKFPISFNYIVADAFGVLRLGNARYKLRSTELLQLYSTSQRKVFPNKRTVRAFVGFLP